MTPSLETEISLLKASTDSLSKSMWETTNDIYEARIQLVRAEYGAEIKRLKAEIVRLNKLLEVKT